MCLAMWQTFSKADFQPANQIKPGEYTNFKIKSVGMLQIPLLFSKYCIKFSEKISNKNSVFALVFRKFELKTLTSQGSSLTLYKFEVSTGILRPLTRAGRARTKQKSHRKILCAPNFHSIRYESEYGEAPI